MKLLILQAVLTSLGGSKGVLARLLEQTPAARRPSFFLEIQMGIEDDFTKQQLDAERERRQVEKLLLECLIGSAIITLGAFLILVALI